MPTKRDWIYICIVAALALALLALLLERPIQTQEAALTITEETLRAESDVSQTEQAFSELLSTMQTKAALFRDPRWGLRTDDTFAEGQLMLLHMLNHSLDVHLGADPERPVFQSWMAPNKKLLGDNPNAIYYDAQVDAGYDYRVTGNIGESTYTSFAVELNQGGVGATLNDAQMEIADDGSYEIFVGSAPPASGNWLRLDPEATSITTRHYYETERNVGSKPEFAVDLRIERLQGPGATPLPTDASVADGINRVTAWLQRNVQPPTPERSPPWISLTPNEFAQPAQADSNQAINYAAPDNVYRMTRWRIAPDEALVITGRFPDCRFANVVLWNDYLQTLPYRYRQISLNREQTMLEPDGSFRVIVAHEDPGHPNWLDAAGREEGVVFWRFLLPTEPVPALETQLMSLADLKALPHS